MRNNTKVNQIVLEKIRKHISMRVSPSFAADMRVFDVEELVTNNFIWHLEFRLFGIHREISRSVQKPLDWWEAVKLRFFPKWLLMKFPIKYETIATLVNVDKFCPHLNIKTTDDEYYHIAWLADEKNIVESDWKLSKSVPDWIKDTVRMLETSAYYVENEHPFLAQDFRSQAKLLREMF